MLLIRQSYISCPEKYASMNRQVNSSGIKRFYCSDNCSGTIEFLMGFVPERENR